MVKLFHAYFAKRLLLLAMSEVLLIFLAMVVSIYVQFGSDSQLVLLYERGLVKIAVVSGVCMVCMYYCDLYDSLVLVRPRELLTRLVQVLGRTSLLLGLLYYVYPAIQIAFQVFIVGAVFTGALILAWRRLFSALNCSPRLAERIILAGRGPLADSLTVEIQKRPELAMNLLGYVAGPTDPESGVNGLRRLGRLDEVVEVATRERADRILVSLDDRRGKLPVTELLQLKTSGVPVEDASNFYEMVTGKICLGSLRLSWLLFSPGFRVSRGMLIYKRLFSILIAGLCLILSLPLMALIALAIRIDSGSPVLFKQPRIGKNGKVFILNKFRTMRSSSDAKGEFRPAQANDHRITRVGRWLRPYRLDELPQLWNILRGDMHFVGPRPFALEEEEKLAQQIPFYRQRWCVKPGATGWAQIQRGYCATLEDNAEKLAYDVFYIKNMSVGLDLLILFRTFKILLSGRGAR